MFALLYPSKYPALPKLMALAKKFSFYLVELEQIFSETKLNKSKRISASTNANLRAVFKLPVVKKHYWFMHACYQSLNADLSAMFSSTF
jgi:hypothetical protein